MPSLVTVQRELVCTKLRARQTQTVVHSAHLASHAITWDVVRAPKAFDISTGLTQFWCEPSVAEHYMNTETPFELPCNKAGG